jgi:hypothetical protein
MLFPALLRRALVVCAAITRLYHYSCIFDLM